MDPPVQVVVVAYHAAEQLARCLDGLEGEVPAIVVDNSSSTDVAAVSERHGAVYVDAGANRGFAAAVNVALSEFVHGRGDILLLNPDAVIAPSAVRRLSAFLRRADNTRVAAVVPRLFGPSGREQRTVWPFPSPGRVWADAVGIGRRLPSHRKFVVGAVLLLRREAIDDVGLFDQRFFLYAEETDWQWRASQRGWISAVCAQATAEHIGAGTSISDQRREALFHAAQETYIRKWYGRAGWRVYRVGACVGAAARALLLTREARRNAARRARLYWWGPCRCAARARD